MIADPWFYAAAVPAVLLAGISKGGFAGGLGMLAVPLMSLTIPPTQAAAIMLPILCTMDLVGVYAYRGRWDALNLRILVAGALAGIILGSLSFRYLDDAGLRLIVGSIALWFTLNRWLNWRAAAAQAAKPSWPRGGFWGAVAGFTSFIAHAGGPPIYVYLLPQRLDKTVYQATTVVFFLVINYVKLVPYTLLGQFTTANLSTAASLLPVAVVGILAGIWAHKRVAEALFYRICYLLLFLTAIKLLADGLTGL